MTWLRDLVEILDSGGSSEELMEATKLEMFQDQVFCFTPKGDLIHLPSNSNSIDFAYALHSEIGNRCVGCKINGKPKPLYTKLQNGDEIEVDVKNCKLHLNVSNEDIEKRLEAYQPFLPDIKGGYQKMYVDHVMQADKGADLDFLVGKRGSEVKRHSH